jgi:ribonuclease PH
MHECCRARSEAEAKREELLRQLKEIEASLGPLKYELVHLFSQASAYLVNGKTCTGCLASGVAQRCPRSLNASDLMLP